MSTNVLSEESWDLIIVLDATRYDYFKEYYGYFFEGELKKVWSAGSCTPEWFRNTFREYYNDVLYISANPHINSYSVELHGCKASDHFARILDVWATDWDHQLGTVLPHSVNRVLRSVSRDPLLSKKRIIAHYIQPHAPYVSPKSFVAGFPHYIGSWGVSRRRTYAGTSLWAPASDSQRSTVLLC